MNNLDCGLVSINCEDKILIVEYQITQVKSQKVIYISTSY
jgi:hypothetical protein